MFLGAQQSPRLRIHLCIIFFSFVSTIFAISSLFSAGQDESNNSKKKKTLIVLFDCPVIRSVISVEMETLSNVIIEMEM